MKIANIYPVANQELYKKEDFVMVLAHLAKKGLYRPECFNNTQYIIMDNGLFEGEQVSQNLLDVIKVAINSHLPVKELVVPDVVNDCFGTIELFEANAATMLRWNNRFTFMVVAQAKNYNELDMMISYYNQYAGKLNLCIGISKLATFDRGSKEAISIYAKSKFPIHFLGIKKTFAELNNVTDMIRSCDTSQIAFIAKNKNIGEQQVWYYTREGEDINLEKDQLSSEDLKKLRIQLIKESADELL